jgi:hypothetical protein
MTRAIFVSQIGPAKWLVFAYDPETEIAFCFADLFGTWREGGAEVGDVNIPELESVVLMSMGWPADICLEGFPPMPFLECIDSDGRIIALETDAGQPGAHPGNDLGPRSLRNKWPFGCDWSCGGKHPRQDFCD